MVNLVEDQRSIVVHRVVSHDVEHGIATENVHHFDLLEVDHRSTTRTARDIFH